MTKTQKAWCVFDPKGKPILSTTEATEYGAIKRYGWNWGESRIAGYTCRKVEIKEVSGE